jgi:hypothetical protein
MYEIEWEASVAIPKQFSHFQKVTKWVTPPGGLEPPTFRLTAERANQLRHGGILVQQFLFWVIKFSTSNHIAYATAKASAKIITQHYVPAQHW